MKLYAYCLIEDIDSLPAPLKGISGAGVRKLNLGNVSLLVSDFAGDTVPINRDNALAHAAVVKSVLNYTTPLPFRFGTLVTEQQLESYVTLRREALQSKLDLVRGCVEMSVKIIADQNRTDEAPAANDALVTPGTAFLAEKRRELLGSEARAAEARDLAVWLENRVTDVVRETRITTNPTERLLLVAAHLVERDSVETYRGRLREARENRPELHFLVSGPWAPYSFANVDLEFKFGVS